ncbi:MAG: hypothetical protein IT557_05270 [Alphaproteobacteria bacterium]|nr:hypothetical protein [Alphaproteobacteria bacterium]
MLTRRTLAACIGAGAALALVPGGGRAAPPSPTLTFAVLRNGARIGQHTVALSRAAETTTVEIRADIAVGIGPFVLYRYAHQVRETWRAGALQRFESETNDDGTRYRILAERRPEGLVIEGAASGRVLLPANALPLTHWNKDCLSVPVFHPQTGEALAARVEPRGQEAVALASGRTVTASRYAISGDVVLESWYDPARVWTALTARGRDGSLIEYRRLS